MIIFFLQDSKNRKSGNRGSIPENVGLRGMLQTPDMNKLSSSKRRTPNLANTSNTNQENDGIYH